MADDITTSTSADTSFDKVHIVSDGTCQGTKVIITNCRGGRIQIPRIVGLKWSLHADGMNVRPRGRAIIEIDDVVVDVKGDIEGLRYAKMLSLEEDDA